jgi:hypothetical protein
MRPCRNLPAKLPQHMASSNQYTVFLIFYLISSIAAQNRQDERQLEKSPPNYRLNHPFLRYL